VYSINKRGFSRKKYALRVICFTKKDTKKRKRITSINISGRTALSNCQHHWQAAQGLAMYVYLVVIPDAISREPRNTLLSVVQRDSSYWSRFH
jgi:hypothetical protein